MKSFAQGNTAFRYVQVPTKDGQRVKRPCGTTDPVTGDAMATMVSVLASKHKWDVLGRVTAKEEAIPLSTVYAHWVSTPKRPNPRTGKPMDPGPDERIEHVLVALNDAALDQLVTDFATALEKGGGTMKRRTKQKISADTVAHYTAAIRLAIPKDSKLTASWMTSQNLQAWIDDMDDVEPATQLKRGAGMRRFTQYLVAKGVLGLDPMADVTLPPPGSPLCHYLDVHEALMLADAQPGQFRLFSAVLSGTGIEVTAALNLRRRDVDLTNMEIRAPGTKAYTRDRIAKVATFAQPYVTEACDGLHPDAQLFSWIPDRWVAADRHNEACDALGMGTEEKPGKGHRVFDFMNETPKRYTMRDQRHTWAVYAVRGGWPTDSVANQLGHVNGLLVSKVYGRFKPTQHERARWEENAASAAQQRAAAIGLRIA